jgi:hypothetical protein
MTLSLMHPTNDNLSIKHIRLTSLKYFYKSICYERPGIAVLRPLAHPTKVH